MAEVVVTVPADVGFEFCEISKEKWQLLFSRFIKRKIDEWHEIESIVSKSKATDEQIGELSDEVSLSITKRLGEK